MVKVECHGCSAPYQIDERRIPPSGLKMRCPKCGTGLLVTRPGEEGAAAPPEAPRPPKPPPPRPAPPQAPQPPTPPAPPGGDWSGVDLPVAAAPRAHAPPPGPMGGGPMGGGLGGGFGEIDLMVGEESGPAGEVDLPVVPTHGQPAGHGFGHDAGGFGHDAGGIDLPAVAPQRGAPAPPAFGGGGFGAIDLGGDTGDEGGVDLPAPRHAPPGPDFGAIDLPAARPQAPPYAPTGGHSGLPAVFGKDSSNTGLPAPFAGGAGLPMPGYGGSNQAGLPMPSGGSTGLPMPGGGMGLPSPSGFGPGGAALPMTAGSGLPMTAAGGLPMPAAGGLPMPATGGLPAMSSGGLPMTSSGGLPMTSSGGLPMTSAGGLPMTSAGGLPTASSGGLPMAGGPGFPQASSGGLPMPGGPGLPTSAAGSGLPSMSSSGLPMAGGPGLPAQAHAGLPVIGGAGLPVTSSSGLPAFDSGAGGEASLGFDLAADGPGGGGTSIMEGGGVGGEIDLDGAKPGAPAVRQRQRSADIEEAPPRKSRGLKIAAGVMAVLGVAGLTTALVPSIGPFGVHAITDYLNQDKYEAALGELRKQAQTDLDEDTLTAGNAAADRTRNAHVERERHEDTAAYAAFTLYMKSLRFGRDGSTEQGAKSLLDKTDRTRATVAELLALAAEDALAGQLPRAKQTIEQIQQKQADDVDAAVLAGEIDLIAKDPTQALASFTRAVEAHKSARTLYGLARAQMALGKTAEAEASAKSVLELSKNHVGARTILATFAGSQNREAEALELLNQVTKDPAVRPGAGAGELVDAYVQIGRVQLGASRMSLAQEAFDEALKLNPQSVPALVGRGELFYRSGRFSNAEANFDSAVKADADNLEGKIGLAKTWIALERFKEAKEHLAKLQAAHGNDTRVDYWLGRVSEALGQRKDAEAFYSAAIDKAKTAELAVPAYVGISTLLAATNRADEASKKLAEAAAKFPDSPELARARGDVALQGGNFPEARSQYEEALKRSPDDLATRFALGVTLRRMRKFDEANAVFNKVSEVDPDYPGLALERGLYYEETGKPDEALKMYEMALQKAPNDVDLKLRIGSTQVIAGAAKQAEPLLKDVLRERQNSAEANHFLGRAMLLSGSNLNEAIRYLKRAVEIDGQRAEYHLYVGWAANEAGQYQIAETALARALELDPTLGDAYWQRGVLLQKQGRSLDAIKDLEVALDKRKSRYEAHATLALCYEDQNNITKAEESWRKAIEGNPNVADWHNKLGLLLANKRDTKNAILELEKAVELAQGRDPRPGWLHTAHRILGENYGTGTKDKCASHLKEYLRLAPPDDAYRVDAQRLLDSCAR
ncbi:MAG: tetratricopeptide repeat protein [Polyangiaceae bacterium]|nr:tetratricopeptide repeat protein [Polyangiaceae bacterium]